MAYHTAQISLLDEIIVDNFAGGGGASTGIELATGRPVNIAINHDPQAILMHKTNHPYTKHLCESVWQADPVELCSGQKVALAWFSPDCKHFSKAKGAALVDRKIRGLAWIVLRWAGTVRPRVIFLENVEEFVTWGPVRHGKPVKSKQGQTFRKWYAQLEALGYKIEHRELVAADYGAPTTRKRFVLVARCDGRPIVWPERTHALCDSEEVKSGKCKPWRSAAEIIDWSLPYPSIFESSKEIKEIYGIRAIRPLAMNTQKRIARGLDKFVIKSAAPFIVPTGYGERPGQLPRINNIADPLGTVVAAGKHMLCSPSYAPWTVTNTTGSTGHPADEPLGTVRTGGGGGQMLVTPVMTAIGQTGFSEDRSYSATEPIKTLVTKAEQCLLMPSLIQYHTEQTENVRGQALETPLATVDGSNRHGLTAEYMTKYYGGDAPGQEVAEPLHTVTAKDREGLVMAHIEKYYGGGYTGVGSDLKNPLDTVTTVDHNALCLAHVAEFKGQDKGQPVSNPLRTITASAGEFGLIKTKLVKYAPGQVLGFWPQVRELLNTHCGYTLAEDEILLFNIGGVWWYISDIGLRMLAPKELYAAQGAPKDYIIDRDYTGKPYPKTEQVARCGNMVCPPIAEAMVRANLPELCPVKLYTMEELNKRLAV